ncbi:MAG TPA: DUF502 domain-containing protein [Thermoguttaceae bacterium]|nr:DUF502 domain-containing protein [Thermoguttaceae bacterium]
MSPPLFTILIFVWVIGITDEYLLTPATNVVRDFIVWNLSDEIRTEPLPEDQTASYHRVANDKYVPDHVYERVKANPGNLAKLEDTTAKEIYRRYVRLEYLSPWKTVLFFLAVFIIVLYLLGKFMAAGIGRFFWGRFEQVIHRLPLVRNVYSSVKQVSDFLFTEREIEYTRVVAVQYPRRGIYSLGLVTGDSMKDIRDAAGEPVMSVLMPTSPMPVTGFTVTVRKSETIDLNITIDQAFQFIISCGVVVPAHQVWARKAKPGELPAGAKPDETTELATRE